MKDILYTKVRDGEWFAMNYKVCTQAVAKALAVHRDGRVVHFPPGRDGSSFFWGRFMAYSEEPDAGESVHLLVRDPVDRLRSSMVEAGDTDVDAVLDLLESGEEYNRHYLAQHLFVIDGVTTFYKFPEGLPTFETWLSYPLDHVHQSEDLPKLSKAQKARVLDVYAKDLQLFESL